MSAKRHLWLGGLAALAVGGLASTGCQTPPVSTGGMTLPSPYYLDHYPQYLASDPPFSHQRELDSMMDPDMGRRAAPGGGAAPPPLPAVPGQLPPPQPANPGPAAPMPPGN